MNKFLLACDKFKPEMHLKQPGFTYAACGPFTRKKELKSLCRQAIQILFTETNLIEFAFSMMWHMANQKT